MINILKYWYSVKYLGKHKINTLFLDTTNKIFTTNKIK